MSYQQKTTVVTMSVTSWTEATECSLSSRFGAMHAVALQIALRCQMDIMSFVPYFLGEKGAECRAAVVFVNNGRSLAEIHSTMQSEIGNNPKSYWMILDCEEWQGLLDFIITVRGTDEEWEEHRV